MTAVQTEPMASRHLDAVRAIDALVYPNPWGLSTWRNELSSADRRHFVASEDDEIVGHAGLLHMVDEVHVTTVAVHPDAEGRGVGTQLMIELLDAARADAATAATLEVRARDRRPQRLYARFGFRPAGVRRGYYSNPADDAIVMWLHELDGDEAADRVAEVARRLATRREGSTT